jgi:hypothetical protein
MAKSWEWTVNISRFHLRTIWSGYYCTGACLDVWIKAVICKIRGFSRRWLWIIASSGILRRVALVRTDISEELSACLLRLTFLLHRFFSPWWWRRYVPPKRRFFRLNTPEDTIIHSHHRENLRSYKSINSINRLGSYGRRYALSVWYGQTCISYHM